MLAALIVLVALLGPVVGALLTRVIDRVPAGLPLWHPLTRCPDCDAPLADPRRARMGRLAGGHRCADCGAVAGARYPLVAAGLAALFVAVTVFAWQRAQLPLLPALLYLTAAGLALAVIDVDVHRLPNAIVLPSYPILAVLLAVAAALSGDWGALARAGIGAAALLAFYLLLVLVYPAGMGWGDVKLSGLLGAVLGYLGWGAVLIGAFAGFALGAVGAVVLMALGRGNRRTALPFGPFMILGAAVGIAAGGPIAEIYLGTLGG